MSLETEIEKALKLAFKKAMPMIVVEGVVTSVDKEKRTCEVDREGLPDLKKVRLNAVLDPGANTLTIFPKSGSKVLCAIVENDPTDAFLIATTEVEEFHIKTATSELSVNAAGIVIKRDGTLKGILDKIVNAMAAITVPTPSGPSGTPNNSAAINGIKDDINKIFRE